MSQLFFRVSFFILIIFSAGCLNTERKITEKESLDFAKNLHESVAERNPNVFNNIFDMEAFEKRIKNASNGRLTDKDLSEIPSALKKRRMGDELLQFVGKEGSYELVKSYKKGDKQHVIFRLYGTGGLNYHDIELIHAGKEIKAADMYIYLTGENLSMSLANIFMQLNGYLNSSGGDTSILKIMNDVKKYRGLEEYDKALSLFDKLPDTLRNQKLFQLIHLQIASQLDRGIYEKALNKYELLFPHEPGMYLLFMDIHMTHNDYDKTLNDINKLDSVINKDPFLDYYRGIIYKQLKDSAKSKLCLERLYKNMPGFGDGLIQLIASYEQTGESEKARAVAKVYKNNKKLNQENLKFLYLLYPDLTK
jgi:tetratricopeptide (TPR) repeat protein